VSNLASTWNSLPELTCRRNIPHQNNGEVPEKKTKHCGSIGIVSKSKKCIYTYKIFL